MFEQPWKYLTELNSVRTISTDNSLIHQGKGFTHSNNHTVANGANLDHLIITPSDVDVHFRTWKTKANDGPCTINAYEDTVVSANGTAEPVGNNNRQSVITPKLLIYHTPTVTSVGTALEDNFIGATGGGAHVSTGESAESQIEWLLKRNTKYLMRVNNASGVSTRIHLRFFWYEL